MPITAPAPALTKERPPVLRNALPGWLAAGAAGLDEEGMVALFTNALRDFRGVRGVVPPGKQSHKRRVGPADRADAARGETEGVA